MRIDVTSLAKRLMWRSSSEIDDVIDAPRARRLATAFGIPQKRALVAARLFNEVWYRRRANLDSAADPFEHFLGAGPNGPPPGPLFSQSEKSADFAEWARSGSRRAPGTWFDLDWYASNYRDVAESDADPVEHFLLHGSAEGRSPCKAFEPIRGAMSLRGRTSPTPHADLLALAPAGRVEALRARGVWGRARRLVQPAFLALQDHSYSGVSEDEARDLFFADGLAAGLRPTPVFNPRDYAVALDAAATEDGTEPPRPRRNPNLPSNPPTPPLARGEVRIQPGVNPFLHWLFVGAPRRILPTPLFDEALYHQANPDLRGAKGWLFDHYAEHGVREGVRRASHVFDPSHWRRMREGAARPPLLVDCVASDDGGVIHPAPTVKIPAGIMPDMALDSRLEVAARALADTAAPLETPLLREAAARAAAIEPLVMKPNGSLRISAAPQSGPFSGQSAMLGDAARTLRMGLGRSSYDTVVLIPHCRMSGATHVGGEMVKALVASRPDEAVLVIQTELSVFERPDWFGEGYDRLDFAAVAGVMAPGERAALLFDLIRGVSPRRVVNVNSRLGWDLYETEGPQLSRIAKLYAYLFCYDIDPCGNKVGYPIQSFQRAQDCLAGVFIDNSRLAQELAVRYRMPEAARRRLHVLFTPEDPSPLDLSNNFARRRSEGAPLRALWAGRLDRQKRFDLVIAASRAMPELAIDAYGKAVMNDFRIDLEALPGTITMKDPYRHIEDLPLSDYDFFLYTSEWDGLPSILIETAMRGMTIVSSDTGGIDDLITETTGWPVRAALDPAAYVATISDLVSRPEEATRRAAELKRSVVTLCDNDRYRADLTRALEDQP